MNLQEKLEREIGEEIKKDLKKLEEKYAVWGLGNQHAERLINKCTTYKDTGFAIRISDAYRGEYTRLYELKKQIFKHKPLKFNNIKNYFCKLNNIK